MFVSGGFTTNGRYSATASVEMLDLMTATAEWTQCASLHEKRAHNAMIAFKSELFVFGGWNGTNKNRETYTWTLETARKLNVFACLLFKPFLY